MSTNKISQVLHCESPYSVKCMLPDRAHMLVKYSLALGCSIMALSALSVGFAQNDDRDDAVTTTRDVITVTARKREESVQEIPLSLTAVPEKDILRIGANDFSDLQFAIPGLVMTSDRRVGIRGISTRVNNIGFSSGVGIHLDGVYLGQLEALNYQLADVSRVEVLRGPQGTLYGRNTIAGTINYIINKPSNDTSLRVRAEYGRYDAINVNATANVPIVEDQVLLRVTAARYGSDGTHRNIFDGVRYNNEDVWAGRTQLRLLAASDWVLDFSFDYLDDGERKNPISVEDGPFIPGGDGTFERFELNQDTPTSYRRQVWGGSFTAEHTFPDGHTLTNIAAYRYGMREVPNSDEDRLPFFVANANGREKDDQISNELRFSSPSGDEFDYIIGLYYLRSSRSQQRGFDFGPAFAGGGLDLEAKFVTDAYAAFTNVNYNLTNQLTLGGGVRVTHETRDLEQISQDSTSFFFPDLGLGDPRKKSDTNVSGEVNIMYDFAENARVYAKMATGYKAGGFNIDILSTFDFIDFDAETVTNYEVGLRSELFDNRVIFNTTAYWMKYNDLQELVFDPVVNNTRILNAAKARSRGFEIELIASPMDGVNLNGGVAFTDAEYIAFMDQGIDFAGETLAQAPKWTANTAIDIEKPIGNLGSIVVRGEATYRSGIGFLPNQGFVQDGFWLLNGRVGFVPPSERWSLFLWGKNLADKNFVTLRTTDFLGNTLATYGDKKTYGIQLNVYIN